MSIPSGRFHASSERKGAWLSRLPNHSFAILYFLGGFIIGSVLFSRSNIADHLGTFHKASRIPQCEIMHSVRMKKVANLVNKCGMR
jgi:hypothetical protein